MQLYDLETLLINAIQKGDIDSIKAMNLSFVDINRPLFIHHIVPIPENVPKFIFPELIDPTPVLYAIACSRVDILEYFAENLKPDFSISCNGWYPIHMASYCENPEILKILMHFDYVQLNIDIPVIEKSLSGNGLYSTTALHIASSYGRHIQAIMLTQDLPAVEFNSEGERIISKNSPTIDDSARQPANPIQKSCSGNTPLHIAAFRGDWDMCQIILNASDDNRILNANEETPAEVAIRGGHKDTAEKIEEMDLDLIEDIQQKYTYGNSGKRVVLEKERATERSVENLRDTISKLECVVEDLTKKICVLEEANCP